MLVSTAKLLGLNCRALITYMDQPLGRAVGNANEMYQTIQILKGDKDLAPDFYEAVIETGAHMLVISGREKNLDKARKLLEEYIWLICFDTTMQCVGIFEISHGSCNQSILHIPQVLQRTLLSGASVIVLGHNHPSGIVIPSNEDIQMTRRLWIASNIGRDWARF